jgi:GAF domain-containing protein
MTTEGEVGTPTVPLSAAAERQATVAAIVTDPRRVAAVRRLVPLYRPPCLTFDRLTELAAGLLTAPVALLTLVDSDRQFFVSSYGLGEPVRTERQTSLEYSICQHVVAAGRPLIVNDTALDARLEGSPAVIELGVAAYAGIPLTTGDGYSVGAFAVLDFVRRDWTDDRLAILAHLAAIAMDEIRLAGLERSRR